MTIKLKDLLKGLSAGKTPEDIAKMHNVSVDFINNQIKKGIKVEYEHTPNKEISRRIAMDHLVEIPDYYDRLEKMESDAKKKEK